MRDIDPIYQSGRVVSYVSNISCSSVNLKQGLWHVLMAHDVEPQESRVLHNMTPMIRERMGFLYNFKGLAFAKSRFQGSVEKTYCRHRYAVPGIVMTAMFRLTRII